MNARQIRHSIILGITAMCVLGILLSLGLWDSRDFPTRSKSGIVYALEDAVLDVPAAGVQWPPTPVPPLNVQLMGLYEGSKISAVAAQGDYAYIGGGNELTILSFQDPALQGLVSGKLQRSSEVQEVVVAGNYAYVGVGQTDLWVVDIANPAAPAKRGGLPRTWQH
jgi:hypothetical protein